MFPSSKFSHCCGNQTKARFFFSDPSLPSFKEKEVCFTGGGHSCSHRGVSHVEFSQSHSKRLIFYHCCSSPSSSFAAVAAARCALLASPCPLCFFPFKKRRGRYKFWPPEASWFGNVMWEPFNDVLLQVLWRTHWVAILVYNGIRYDAPTRIKYIQTFVHQI